MWKNLWRMWKTVSFPQIFFHAANFQGCVKNALPTFTIPPSANTGLSSARGWQKAQPGAIAQKRFAFSPVFFLRLPFFPREAKKFCEFHQIFRRMVFSSPGDTKEALIKSARAGSERFCSRARYGKRGNTACISRFSYRRPRAKDPLSSRRRFIQSFLKSNLLSGGFSCRER